MDTATGSYVIAELERRHFGPDRQVLHLTDEARCDDLWAPILCDEETGITLPGAPYLGEPTCPQCLKILSKRGQARA